MNIGFRTYDDKSKYVNDQAMSILRGAQVPMNVESLGSAIDRLSTLLLLQMDKYVQGMCSGRDYRKWERIATANNDTRVNDAYHHMLSLYPFRAGMKDEVDDNMSALLDSFLPMLSGQVQAEFG